MKKSFIEELTWRGMIQDMTPGLEEKLNSGMVIGYIGFDPTAPSMTIGNYVQLMLLSHFQRCGHKPIVLMGGATGRVGDPSGKDAERELKSYDELDRNLAFQVEQVKKLLDFDSKENGAILINNLDFYKDMNVLTFLRDVGKNLTINYMMAKESVKRRVEIGMSYTEFSYQLLQAYDYLCLYRQQGCVLQMGGSDQWGNIMSGKEFIRRNEPNAEVHALTSPLLTKADGKKFGKSEEGNIWLDPKMTSPYKFYQFWLNIDDRDVSKLIRYFSLSDREEIEENEKLYSEYPNVLKRLLGEELTVRIFGEKGYQEALDFTNFHFNQDRNFLLSMDEETFYRFKNENMETMMIGFDINKDVINLPMKVIDLLYLLRLFKSTSEVRRAIEQGAVSINLEKISDINRILTPADLLHGKYIYYTFGKKDRRVISIYA
jgi:tyrosyl-tRNA synthetase